MTINGVAVTYVSGTNFTIDSGDPSGQFTTNQIGSYDIVVNFGSSISGQNIVITDCASAQHCCTTNGSGGTCTFSGASITNNCTITIAAADGACA